MYLIYCQGVYGQGVYGIFSTFEKAKNAADKQAENDRDDYHEWQVHEFELDNFDDEGKEVYQTRKQT